MPPNITNGNRPAYEAGGGTLAPSLPGRKTGRNKLTIPIGKLTQYLGDWAKPPGVLRALLDLVLDTEGATAVLGAETETTTMQRQILVAGENKMTSRTSEAKLDKLAASLMRRALDHEPEITDDALLTALGFRTAVCETKLDFIERLVALQLVLRRGLEFRSTNPETTDIPMFGFSVHMYNAYDWDASLATAEAANVASPQKKSTAKQLEDMEADIDDDVDDNNIGNKPAASNDDMVASIKKIMDGFADRLKAVEKHAEDEEPKAKKRRTDDGGTFDLDTHTTHTHFAPQPNLPSAEDTTTDPERTADAIFQQVEADPGESVNADVIPEVAKKYKQHSRITVATVFSYICSSDLAQRFQITQADDGNIELARTTTSSRKVATFYELTQVTDATIDSIYSVEACAGFKLRQYFVQTINTAHRNLGNDLAMTIACWNAHMFQWIKGLNDGVNTKLKCSTIIEREVRAEFTALRRHDKVKTDEATNLKDIMRQIAKNGNNKNGGGPNVRWEGSAKLINDPPQSMRDADCLAYLAGKDCRFVDSSGNCPFNHTGLTKGSDPAAQKNHYEKNKK